MANDESQDGFTAEERAAMKERAAELKASARRGSGAKKAEADEVDCLAKIAEMPDADRVIAEALHADRQGHRPRPGAQDLVRHARLRQGRQGRGLLQARRRSSRCATPRSGSTSGRTSTTATCGRPCSLSPR